VVFLLHNHAVHCSDECNDHKAEDRISDERKQSEANSLDERDNREPDRGDVVAGEEEEGVLE
jgi:hypothetical protein